MLWHTYIFFSSQYKVTALFTGPVCRQLAGTSSADCNANYDCNKCAPRTLACAHMAPQRWWLSASESAVRGVCEQRQWGRLKRKTCNHAVITKPKRTFEWRMIWKSNKGTWLKCFNRCKMSMWTVLWKGWSKNSREPDFNAAASCHMLLFLDLAFDGELFLFWRCWTALFIDS